MKRKITEGIDLPNLESIKSLEERGYFFKFLRILEVITIKQTDKRKLFKTLLGIRNLIKVINTWTVPHYKILWTILKTDKEGNSIDGPKNKEINNDAQCLYTQEMK